MSVNPFDLKTVLLAKHAQHVVLIHFPIALFTVAVAFDFLAQWAKSRTLAAAAYFNLLLAAGFTVPVVATGLAAWQWALEGQKLKGILLMHLVLGCRSAAAAYFNLLLAAGFTVPVVATGLAAWQWALEGQKLKGILLMHLVLGC